MRLLFILCPGNVLRKVFLQCIAYADNNITAQLYIKYMYRNQ